MRRTVAATPTTRYRRAITARKDSPPLHLVAPSILEWIEAYADGVEAGEYEVEGGR